MSKFRLFITTDIHGSDVCFRKFLNAAKVYEASVLVLGGDITGKLLIPLVDQGQGRYRYHWLDRDVVTDLEGIAAAEREIRAAAAYSFRTEAVTSSATSRPGMTTTSASTRCWGTRTWCATRRER